MTYKEQFGDERYVRGIYEKSRLFKHKAHKILRKMKF